MNNTTYQGRAPYQTAAQRERAYIVRTLGQEAVDAQDAARVEYYRNLWNKVIDRYSK